MNLSYFERLIYLKDTLKLFKNWKASVISIAGECSWLSQLSWA